MKIQIILIAGLIALLFSCNEPAKPSVKEQLSKSWTIASVTTNGIADAAAVGKTWTFSADGSASLFYNGQPKTSTWELDQSDKLLTLDKGTSSEVVLTIVKVSPLQLEETIAATFKEAAKTRVYIFN